jgi:hypothetical protein
MPTTEMSPIIAAAQAGDTIVVRHAGGRPTTYKVRSVGGRKARELKLEGRRGSMRVLVDGGDQIWIREASARASDRAAHRRVLELSAITRAPEGSEATLTDRWDAAGQLLRDMAVREAGLPPGYDIELHPRGFQPARLGVPVSPVQPSAWVAVCKCWQYHAEHAEHDAQIAVLSKGVMPPGYDTMTFFDDVRAPFIAVLDEPGRPVVSPCTRQYAVEAIVDAWSDESAKFRKLATDRWDCIVEHAQAEARVLDRLPPGYTIEPGDPGYFRAVEDVADWRGQIRTSSGEAVVDAWTHAKGKLLSTLSTTATSRDVSRGDASRCRRALQQILEIVKGLEPTGMELKSGEMPEQVAAEVGHALRVESRAAARRFEPWIANASDVLAWAATAGTTAGTDTHTKHSSTDSLRKQGNVSRGQDQP